MVLQTPTNNNERSSDEILEMAVWLDMESGPAGYGEEEMNFSARRVPDAEVKHKPKKRRQKCPIRNLKLWRRAKPNSRSSLRAQKRHMLPDTPVGVIRTMRSAT